jgi:hypothetical protein
MMFGYTAPVAVFTVGACAGWALALWWAFKQPKYRWYYVWLLGLVTLFWWLGESIAIRLGKYQYRDFPLRVPLPGGGTPDDPGPLVAFLRRFLLGESLPSASNPICVAKSWDIPLPVVAFEAALLFGLFRLSVRLLRHDEGGLLRAALATAGLSALLLVNVTAVLDPVVSTTTWCETTPPNQAYQYLHVGLWEWFTTKSHEGYWFGVPLVNYAGWFLAAAAFSFVARLDDQRDSGLIRQYKLLVLYVLATALITSAFFVILIPVKVAVDRIMVHGQDYLFGSHHVFTDKTWQFGTIVALFGLGGLAVARGRRHHHPQFDWIPLVPKVLAFIFCLALLVIEPHIGILAVWFVTAVIAAIVLLSPFVGRLTRPAPRPEEHEDDDG